MTKTIAFASVFLACSIAHADGTCSGAFSGSIGLAVPKGTSGFTPVEPQSVAFKFNAAECQCDSGKTPDNDIHAAINLTNALPPGAQGTVELWVGQGCDDLATRTGGKACEKIGTLPIADFTTASRTGTIYAPIPAAALFAPVTHVCAPEMGSNGVYVIAYTDPAQPLATCSLPLTENGIGPAAVTDLQIKRDDSGDIDVSWVVPAAGATSPFYYQVMCSPDASVPPNGDTLLFTSCTNGVLARPGAVASGDFVPCSGLLASTTTTFRLGGAAVGNAVQVMAVDLAGNATGSAIANIGGPGTILPPTTAVDAPAHGCSFAASAPAAPAGVLLMAVLFLVAALRRMN